MTTIGEIFNKKAVGDGKSRFGVEIELEGVNRDVGRVDGWSQEADGSLRDNGREFVFAGAKTLVESRKAFTELHNAFNRVNLRPKATNLTSTHIHIDIRDLTVQQFLNLVAIIMMVEEDLANASGEDRKTNYFALSTCESDHRLRDLIEVKDDEGLRAFVRNQVRKDVRYSGINFNSIHQHGSLELRYLGGKANPNEVMPWLVFYDNCVKLAKKGLDFEELFRNISIDGTAHIERLIQPNFPLTIENVIEGIRNAQMFILGTVYREISADHNGNGLHNYYMNH